VLSNATSMKKSDLLKIIGSNVKRIRLSNGFAQIDLASRVVGSIDTTNISRIESGRTNPTIFTLYRIANALEVPVSELTTLDNPED